VQKTRSCASRSSFNLTSSPFLCYRPLSSLHFLSSFSRSSDSSPPSHPLFSLSRASSSDYVSLSSVSSIRCFLSTRVGTVEYTVTFVMVTWSYRAVLGRIFSGLMPQNELVSFFALALRKLRFFARRCLALFFVAFVAHLFAFLLESRNLLGS